MEYGRRHTRYVAAATILLLLGSVDGALFDWRGTAALSSIIKGSLERQAETAETKVEIYDALWGGLLGVPVRRR
ncbi:MULTISPECIES: hypothetical protein [unclassified Mesorhizobium]|uniref:hypothetical protein n=1 Tax=unclassified Mesorhizobium TaxID=325217 RepID=UPI000466B4E7|nr:MULTISPECIES: hypothetical protein [unclassified Mesorhizobium]